MSWPELPDLKSGEGKGKRAHLKFFFHIFYIYIKNARIKFLDNLMLNDNLKTKNKYGSVMWMYS